MITLFMMKRRILVTALFAASATMLAGCSTSVEHTAAGSEIYKNSSTLTGGTEYYATGSQGDGVDDARVTIETLKQAPEAVSGSALPKYTTETLLPFKNVRGGANGDKVRMTVESLSKNGKAECQISHMDMIIHDVAEGDHAKAVCEGVLNTWADHTK